jgi:uncharacterized BrkB/YihY/UPF0761 family membrane protein
MKTFEKNQNVKSLEIYKQTRTKRSLSWLAFISFILALVFIFLAFLSIHRIETVQSPSFPVCLVREEPLYIAIHNLSAIIPAVAILTGLLALFRIVKSRKIRFDFTLACAGIAISTITLTIYWFELNHLAEHLH